MFEIARYPVVNHLRIRGDERRNLVQFFTFRFRYPDVIQVKYRIKGRECTASFSACTNASRKTRWTCKRLQSWGALIVFIGSIPCRAMNESTQPLTIPLLNFAKPYGSISVQLMGMCFSELCCIHTRIAALDSLSTTKCCLRCFGSSKPFWTAA
jgi:hypothetical protein